jgi:hypothetical protein
VREVEAEIFPEADNPETGRCRLVWAGCPRPVGKAMSARGRGADSRMGGKFPESGHRLSALGLQVLADY